MTKPIWSPSGSTTKVVSSFVEHFESTPSGDEDIIIDKDQIEYDPGENKDHHTGGISILQRPTDDVPSGHDQGAAAEGSDDEDDEYEGLTISNPGNASFQIIPTTHLERPLEFPSGSASYRDLKTLGVVVTEVEKNNANMIIQHARLTGRRAQRTIGCESPEHERTVEWDISTKMHINLPHDCRFTSEGNTVDIKEDGAGIEKIDSFLPPIAVTPKDIERLVLGTVGGQSVQDRNMPARFPTPEPSMLVSGEVSDSDAFGRSFYSLFITSRGNEYFCEIDEDYLTDRFNLTGLNTDVQYYQYALDLVTDVFDLDCDDDMRDQIEKSARHLYGLVHARYITTTRGLAKMLDKYKKGDFGKCPRVDCKSGHLLPTGMADVPNVQHVKLYCAKCEDLYNPKSSRHSTIDGAYFGSSFQNILFQVYPALVPEKSISRYEPKIFGFKVHAAAALQRWQDKRREEMQVRLKNVGLESPFGLPAESVDGEMEEDDDDGEGFEGEGMDIGEVEAPQ